MEGGWRRVPHSRVATALLVSLLAWECAVLVVQARQKPLWYDELVTFHVSAVRPVSNLWKALEAGVDGLPIGYYLLVQAGRILPGPPELTLRAWSIAGYLLALVGVYAFLARRLPATAGLAAALLLSLTPLRAYAVEARPYALMVGLLALAAACWQRLDDRRIMTALLAVFLALAVSSHYYAVVGFAAFVAAEATVTAMSRKIRWRAWAAFLVGGLPFLIGLPILLGFRAAYGGMFWSRPMWEEAVWTYSTYLGTSITAALLLLAFLTLALYGSAPFSRTSGVQQGDRTFSVAEMALLVAFLWLPAVLVFAVKLSGGGYTARYGWPAVFAFVVAIIAIGWQNERTRKPLLAALLIAFAYQVRVDARQMHATASPPATRWAALAAVSEREPGVPVVIASPISYLEAAQYAPAAIKDRLVGVFDLQKQAALFGTDTPDRANRLLVLITRLQLQGPIAFEAAHGRFLVYSGGDYDWFTPHLLAHDYRLRLLAVDRGHPMYIVESATPSK